MSRTKKDSIVEKCFEKYRSDRFGFFFKMFLIVLV